VVKAALGELVPLGGGDAIPLKQSKLKVGRRESCDVCLRFPNISGTHCELSYKDGYWVIRDLNSTNGIKVNGERLRYRALRPGDKLTIGKRDYTIHYELHAEGQAALESVLAEYEDMNRQSLMEKAGLTKQSRLNPYGMVDGKRAADEDGDDEAPFDDDD
jgi:adenylate cyclase